MCVAIIGLKVIETGQRMESMVSSTPIPSGTKRKAEGSKAFREKCDEAKKWKALYVAERAKNECYVAAKRSKENPNRGKLKDKSGIHITKT